MSDHCEGHMVTGFDACFGRDATVVLTVVSQGVDGITILSQVEIGRLDATDTWWHAYDKEGKHVLSFRKPEKQI